MLYSPHIHTQQTTHRAIPLSLSLSLSSLLSLPASFLSPLGCILPSAPPSTLHFITPLPIRFRYAPPQSGRFSSASAEKKLARLIRTAAPSCMSHHYTVAELFYYSNLDNKHNKQDLIELSSDKGVDHVDGDAMNTSEQLVPDIRPRRNNVDNRSIRSSYTERLNKFLSSIIHRPSSIMNDPSSIHHSSSIINNSSSILHHLSAMIHHQ